jgi:hypothetical protein
MRVLDQTMFLCLMLVHQLKLRSIAIEVDIIMQMPIPKTLMEQSIIKTIILRVSNSSINLNRYRNRFMRKVTISLER